MLEFFFGVYDKERCWSLGSFQPGQSDECGRCAARVARMRAVCRFITYPVVQPRRVLPVGCANWPRRSICSCTQSLLALHAMREVGLPSWRKLPENCLLSGPAWILDDSLCQEAQIGSTRDKIFLHYLYCIINRDGQTGCLARQKQLENRVSSSKPASSFFCLSRPYWAEKQAKRAGMHGLMQKRA